MPQPQHQIQATSSNYTTAHDNAWSITHWARPRIEPASSWMLVGFAEPQGNSQQFWSLIHWFCYQNGEQNPNFFFSCLGWDVWKKIASSELPGVRGSVSVTTTAIYWSNDHVSKLTNTISFDLHHDLREVLLLPLYICVLCTQSLLCRSGVQDSKIKELFQFTHPER